MADSLTYAANMKNLEPVVEAIDFIEGDICDSELVDYLVERHDVIVNFAGESHVDNSLKDPGSKVLLMKGPANKVSL